MPKPGRTDDSPAATKAVPVWRNIVIRNITATNGTRSAGLILGLPESPAQGITLEHVRIEAPTGLRIGYAKDVTLHDVQVKVASGEPIRVEDTVEDLQRE